MKNGTRTKEDLINELTLLRQDIAELKKLDAEQKQKEESLRESEERYRFMFTHMNSGVAVYQAVDDGKDFIFKDFNAAAEHISRVSRDKVIGKRLLDLFPEMGEFGLFSALQRVYQTSQSEHLPAAYYKDPYREGWRDNFIYKLPSGDVVAIYEDVTTRKQVELALRESEEKYRALASTVDSMYLVDRECRYQFMNEIHLSRLWVSLKEVIGRTYAEFHSKEDTEWFTGTVEAVFETGKSFQTEYRTQRDGKCFLRTFSPVKDTQGSITAVTVISKDITERTRAEEILKESEKKYRELTDFLPISIFEIDTKGNITSFNRTSLNVFRYKYEDTEGVMNALQFFVPEEWERVGNLLQQIIQGTSLPGQEFIFMRKDGSTFPGLMYASSIIHENKPVGLRGAIINISERKKAEKTIQQSLSLLSATLESTQDGILVVDRQGHVSKFNHKFLALWNISESIAATGDDDTLLACVLDQLKDSDTFLKKVKELYSQPEVESIDVIEFKNGKILERYSQPQKMGGEIVGRVWSFRDVTERKQAEEERHQSYERLRKALGATVQAISMAVETKDPYTAGHQRRVADFARAIATEMGLSREQIEGLRIASVIHDIGKISIPAEILSKPTKLTDMEFCLIKTHVQCGYDILKDIEFNSPIARIVLEHHERMNGSGYPNKLIGKKLLIESRILAVADVVEAMASHRPYRPAIGINAAMDEVAINRGVLYDPEVVDVCKRLIFEKGYKFDNAPSY
jgi:PAS domain S-box-containing protein